MRQGIRGKICFLTSTLSSYSHSPVVPVSPPRSATLKLSGLTTFYSLENYQGPKDHLFIEIIPFNIYCIRKEEENIKIFINLFKITMMTLLPINVNDMSIKINIFQNKKN